MTRDEAKAAGLKRYMPTEPCLRGHLSERFTIGNACCQCLLERGRDPNVKALRAGQYLQKIADSHPERVVKTRTQSASNSLRKEAKTAGLKHYIPTELCIRGHSSKRLVSTGQCCQCLLERSQRADVKAQKATYERAPKRQAYNRAPKRKELAKAWGREYRSTPEYLAYAEANRQKRAEYAAAYNKTNPHLIAAQNAKRRAAKLQATPPWADFEAIKAVYRLCAEVTRITGEKNHVDHIIPLISKKVCGLHVAANLQILTASDNFKKSNKLLPMHEVPELAI